MLFPAKIAQAEFGRMIVCLKILPPAYFLIKKGWAHLYALDHVVATTTSSEVLP